MSGLTLEIYRDAKKEGIAQGMEKGIAQGMEKGIAQGMEKGIAQGMEKGIAQGMQQGTKNILNRLVKQGLISKEEAKKQLAIG